MPVILTQIQDAPENPPRGECGEPAEITEQKPAERSQSHPPRREPHLVLTRSVTGSPGLNLRPHTFQFFIRQPYTVPHTLLNPRHVTSLETLLISASTSRHKLLLNFPLAWFSTSLCCTHPTLSPPHTFCTSQELFLSVMTSPGTW